MVLQSCILNAATLWKGKERTQQGEWCLVNKRLQELLCVVLQGYSPFPSISAQMMSFLPTSIALNMHTSYFCLSTILCCRPGFAA